MRITHLGHACLLVEIADTRLLVDPGNLAPDWDGVRDLDAVLVTHQHPDHLDVDRLPALLTANPEAVVVVDPGSADVLRQKGIDVTVQDGTAQLIGAATVAPVGSLHALINEAVPRVPNVGLRIEAAGEPSLYVTGDALDGEPGAVDVVAFALAAPWQRSREMTALLARLAAPVAVPVHDGILSTAGRGIYLNQARTLGHPDTEVRDLAGRGPTVM